jgi:hypothetical protein
MKKLTILLVLMALLALLTVTVYAQTGSGYALTWWTIDGGGSQNIGGAGGYALSGTIGQPDPGVASGGSYEIMGGYWGGAPPVGYNNYLPTIVR